MIISKGDISNDLEVGSMGSTIKTRLWRHNGTDYDTVHLETDGSVVEVELSGGEVSILNTDSPVPGQHDVYFTAYPSIKWHVDHVDGDYVYLGLYTLTETTRFGSNTTYAGSTIASKCTTFLNNTIPNVADYLEDVTVEGVTNKVFIPTYYQMSGQTGYGDTSGPVFTYVANASAATRKTIISNDWTQNPPNYAVWLSTADNSSYVWYVRYDGNFSGNTPSRTYGFRPEVKINYKQTVPVTTTKSLNTVISDLSSNIINGGTTPPIGKQPVNGLWFEDVN